MMMKMVMMWGDEGGGEIEWKQKNKSQYGTCDKNILIPLSIKIHKDVPFLMKQKRGFFYLPTPCMFQCLLLGIFFCRHPLGISVVWDPWVMHIVVFK